MPNITIERSTTERVITGEAEHSLISNNPVAALTQFYHAFNNTDLELMAKNWYQGEEISMSNPLGGLKRGWQSIKPVYVGIFQGKAKVYVEFHDYSIVSTEDMFCAIGRERGYFKLADKKIALAIRTSRTFQRFGDTWQQVHHHGSIDNPELLAEYQQAVLGQ